MSLIDLRGKALYAGSQKIASAYLGERLIHGQPSMVQPVDYTGSTIAVNVQNGKMNEYVNTTSSNVKVVSSGATFASAPAVTPTILSNSVMLENQAIAVKTGMTTTRADFYAEVTFKNSTFLAKRYAYFLVNGYSSGLFGVMSDVPLPSYQATIGSRGSTKPMPKTEYVTFSITNNSTEGKLYVNGNLLETLSGNTSAAEYLIIGASTVYQTRISTTFDRIDIVDFKWGATAPSEAQIVANYQNIQERLKNI